MSDNSVHLWLSGSDMQVLNVSPSLLEKWAEEISCRYREKWRYYHTLHHLSDMMNHLGTWRSSVVDYVAIVLAILFHDIIYDPKSSSNETDSVEVFKRFSNEVQLSDRLAEKVISLITATIHHVADKDCKDVDPDLTFFLDFDMAILGQSQQVYEEYAANIQKEYCHMSSGDFCKGRTKVLQSFLGRPRIYATDELRGVFEHQARENMQREIEALQMKTQSY